MQAEAFVTDAHPAGLEADVLQYGGLILQREGKVFFHQSGMFLRTGDFVCFQTAKPYMSGIIHNTLELFHRLKKAGGSILVGYLFGQQESPAKGIEVTLPAAAFAGCLRQEQVAFVIQVRSFIEMQLIAACQEALFSVIGLRTVGFLDEPVLFADDTMFRQYLHGFDPGGVHGLILVRRYRVQFGQFHFESHGQVGILAHDTAVFYRQQGESAFQRFRL
ncbi:hypothetical protein BACEGG_00474 [Bacteroides eggerthii DSM 20697]|nr:hypothetical protein BACEGG_00474 [Bacteroides eggerthii DSM 20697]